MTFTNLAGFPIFKINDVPGFQAGLRNFTFLVTIVFIIAVIANYWVKDKYTEWTQKDSGAVKIVESHLLLPKIRDYARNFYSIQLGDCIKIQGLMAHKEAGSVPTTRFFLFEEIHLGEVVGYSSWVVHYVRSVNIHLFNRYSLGRNSYNKYWTGEYRNEQHQSIAETTGGKKTKDISHVNDVNEDNSMTQDSD